MLATAQARSKSPEAFRTISEVALELDVPQHVLRFWEGRFAQIKPVKRAGGRRYYRPEDVDLLRGIRRLLYHEGFTIKGVQKILRDRGHRHVAELGRGETEAYVPERRIEPTAPTPVPFTRFHVVPLERAVGPAIEPEPAIVEEQHASTIAEEELAAPAMIAETLAEEERVKLEILLAELLQLKAKLRTAAPKI